ncbi:hypothetical protein [Nocardia jejuensis]|uniref:hypothetical protein n=1 Tax=Nocardia jejuensis TaxID=328049 RepID=UPI0012FBE88F|nr:hypothetical protein [Nocardia jejuensis]
MPNKPPVVAPFKTPPDMAAAAPSKRPVIRICLVVAWLIAALTMPVPAPINVTATLPGIVHEKILLATITAVAGTAPSASTFMTVLTAEGAFGLVISSPHLTDPKQDQYCTMYTLTSSRIHRR